MPVSLYSGKVARKLLLLQLLTFVLFSVVFSLKSVDLGYSALSGGLSAWLPNILFMLFAWRYQTKEPAPGRVAWSFAIGEALKVVLTITLLIFSLAVLKVAFFPLGLTYLAVLVVQVLAPAVINSYRD